MFYFLYRINCVDAFIKLEAQNRNAALQETKQFTAELFEGRPVYEEALLLVVSEVIDDDLPIEDWYQELEAERLRQEEVEREAHDRTRYERVKQEYETLKQRFGD